MTPALTSETSSFRKCGYYFYWNLNEKKRLNVELKKLLNLNNKQQLDSFSKTVCVKEND